MMKDRHLIRMILTSVIAILLTGLIRRRLDGPRRMPHLELFKAELAKMWDPPRAAAFADRVQARYETLMVDRPHYRHLALQKMHLENNILPGLALYLTLREQFNQEAALAIVESLFTAMAQPSRRLYAGFGRVPRFYTLLRGASWLMMRFGYPESGWKQEWLENSHERIAFNIYSCFYVDVLRAYGAPELVPQFCRLDDLVYKDLWPTVRWGRSMTLARGGPLCDFQFEHTPIPKRVILAQ